MIEVENALSVLSLPKQRYIEVIGELSRERGQARLTDIARRLEVRLPSASEAVKRLAEQGWVVRDAQHAVGLTARGQQVADRLDGRHQALKRFMVDVMAMQEAKADEVACRVEHCVDGDFAERLRKLAEFLEQEYPWTLKGIADSLRERRTDAFDSLEASAGI